MNISIKVKNGDQLKELTVPVFTTVEQALIEAGVHLSNEYEENAVVGALVNGRPVSLGVALQASGIIVPISVREDEGRRIYRHSLSYLLFYCAHLVCPDRKPVIGHSLGNGFYFSFSDSTDSSSDEFFSVIEKIRNKMLETINQKADIKYVSWSLDEAVNYFKEKDFVGTSELLSTTNNNVVFLYKLNDYYDIAYEPIVSNTQVLSKWELMQYKNGMLLRYPVSSSINKIEPFKDSPALFSVFEDYKKWGKILGVSSVYQINNRVSDGSISQFVRLLENLQRKKLFDIADMITERKAKAVFISGPSSSGKTTFSKKVAEMLMLMGFNSISISLDDYYRPRQEIPLDSNGEKDYECVEALRYDLFHDDMKSFFSGKETFFPHWNFAKQERTYNKKGEVLSDKTILVIEGLHGLNPVFTSSVDDDKIFKIYISALTQLNLDGHNRISTTDNRIIRRVVRDYRVRGISARETLNMWHSVSAGESKHVFPYQNNADIMFNSALDYELGVLSQYAIPLLKAIKTSDGDAYTISERLLDFLDNFYIIPSSSVPSDSLLREFIGGGVYE